MAAPVELRGGGAGEEGAESERGQASFVEVGDGGKETGGGGAGRVTAGGTSWLEQMKAKESSYKVLLLCIMVYHILFCLIGGSGRGEKRTGKKNIKA